MTKVSPLSRIRANSFCIIFVSTKSIFIKHLLFQTLCWKNISLLTMSSVDRASVRDLTVQFLDGQWIFHWLSFTNVVVEWWLFAKYKTEKKDESGKITHRHFRKESGIRQSPVKCVFLADSIAMSQCGELFSFCQAIAMRVITKFCKITADRYITWNSLDGCLQADTACQPSLCARSITGRDKIVICTPYYFAGCLAIITFMTLGFTPSGAERAARGGNVCIYLYVIKEIIIIIIIIII